MIDCHTAHIACRFDEIIAKIDRRTGKTIEDHPQFIKANDGCLVRMIPLKPLSVEAYTKYPPLGRFAIRDMKKTVGVGIIKEVTRKERSIKKK